MSALRSRPSERPEGDDRARIGDAGNALDLLADEMADIDVIGDVELGEDVEIAGNRINFRGDFGLGQGAGNLVGLAELAFDFDEKGPHRRVPASIIRAREAAGPPVSTVQSRGGAEFRFTF